MMNATDITNIRLSVKVPGTKIIFQVNMRPVLDFSDINH